ncbi:DUF4397 domain-containing protein [Mucilaginibacter sp. BT774]|uniref:DUF4397 domain-containing protein n=1 Tax=Mucilaginibacter sp. BT774 TaxID=3062276 RepID=UPI0026774CF0|nr:DUF4397 domain-containing protein [Mucilaginibacter sp. BT774]MDO3625878.1 DUF4397 domain-containing protein [Mucilaginibacter sp. BT774]
MPFISSCGKNSNSNAAALNIQYQIVNLNSGIGSVDLYVNYVKVNSFSYFYPNSSGYFYLPSITTPFQVRRGTSRTPGTVAPSYNFLTLNNVLVPNTRYTLMLMGQDSSTLYSIFTADTSSSPSLGKGKLRFVNASPNNLGQVSVTANDTTAFAGVPYKTMTKFIELTAGTYDFKIYQTGSPNVLLDRPNVTIQNGKIYTMYCYGLANRTDSLAFGSGFITNK